MNFFLAQPTLDLFLSCNGHSHISECLIPDEVSDTVSFSEARNAAFTMFPRTACDVICYTRIKSPGFAGDNVCVVHGVSKQRNRSFAALRMTSSNFRQEHSQCYG